MGGDRVADAAHEPTDAQLLARLSLAAAAASPIRRPVFASLAEAAAASPAQRLQHMLAERSERSLIRAAADRRRYTMWACHGAGVWFSRRKLLYVHGGPRRRSDGSRAPRRASATTRRRPSGYSPGRPSDDAEPPVAAPTRRAA